MNTPQRLPANEALESFDTQCELAQRERTFRRQTTRAQTFQVLHNGDTASKNNDSNATRIRRLSRFLSIWSTARRNWNFSSQPASKIRESLFN